MKFLFNKIILIVLVLFLIPHPVTCQSVPTLPNGMPQLSEAEMDAFVKELLENLDEDTLNELAKIGEQIIKEAQDQGYDDPFEYLTKLENEAQQKLAEEIKPVPPVVTPEKPQEPKQAPVSIKKIEEIQGIIDQIIRSITSARQKTSEDIALSNAFSEVKYPIDDLIYYLTIIKQEKFIKFLLDKESEQLYENLRSLSYELFTLEHQLAVPEFSLLGESPYDILDIPHTTSPDEIVNSYETKVAELNPQLIQTTLKKQGKSPEFIKSKLDEAQQKYTELYDAYSLLRAKEESKYIVEKILAMLKEALYTNNLLEELKKLIKKYEPEELKKKEERDKVEEQARKTQEEAFRRIPLPQFTMPYYPSADSTYTGSGLPAEFKPTRGLPEYTPPFSGFELPTAPSSKTPGGELSKAPTTTPSVPKGPGGDKKPEAGKEEDKGKKPEAGKGKEESKGKGPEKAGAKPPAQQDLEVMKRILKVEDSFDTISFILKDAAPQLQAFTKQVSQSIDPTDPMIPKTIATIETITREYKKLVYHIENAIKDLKKDKAKMKQYSTTIGKITDKVKESKLFQQFIEFLKLAQNPSSASLDYRAVYWGESAPNESLKALNPSNINYMDKLLNAHKEYLEALALLKKL